MKAIENFKDEVTPHFLKEDRTATLTEQLQKELSEDLALNSADEKNRKMAVLNAIDVAEIQLPVIADELMKAKAELENRYDQFLSTKIRSLMLLDEYKRIKGIS